MDILKYLITCPMGDRSEANPGLFLPLLITVCDSSSSKRLMQDHSQESRSRFFYPQFFCWLYSVLNERTTVTISVVRSPDRVDPTSSLSQEAGPRYAAPPKWDMPVLGNVPRTRQGCPLMQSGGNAEVQSPDNTVWRAVPQLEFRFLVVICCSWT